MCEREREKERAGKTSVWEGGVYIYRERLHEGVLVCAREGERANKDARERERERVRQSEADDERER